MKEGYCKYVGDKDKDYFYPKDNGSKFTMEECAKKCRNRDMQFMSHGRDSRNKNNSCDPSDSGCKGRCYCYKKCEKVASDAYNVYKIPMV